MCGIAGFCNTNTNYSSDTSKWITILHKMKNSIKHRGPDSEGFYLSRHVGFAHARLAIIDLVTGDLPLTRIISGNSYTILYNGEIYNMNELKKELIYEGYEFETKSDAEVVLVGYIAHGCDYLSKLNGIFAFAIWDNSLNKLLLVRDRLGIKPLFYTIRDNSIIFASELKALFNYPDINPILDKNGLSSILALGPAKACGCGVFKNINEILPGHYLIFDDYGIQDTCYWNLVSKPHEETYEETVAHTRELVYDAVKKQLLSDVPISTFLSGGVDSSLVTAIAARELAKEGKILNSFSFEFKDNNIHFKSNSFQPSLDGPYVDIMVNHSNTNHIYLECDNELLADYLYDAVDARDLPGMADVESSLLYFCSKVVSYNKVTLTGECADEIFGGYPWFHKKEVFERDAFPWSYDMNPRQILLHDDLLAHLDLADFSKNAYHKSVNETPYLDGENEVERRRREIAYLNLRWFMVTLLDRMDRTSMYSGLEARVPFADHRIVEYIWNVPWDMKCKNGVVKGLLRAAGEEYLPYDVLYRKKSPYPKTYNPTYEKIISERLLEEVNLTNSPINQIIDKNKLLKFIDSPSDYGKPFYGQLMAGPQLLAYMLQINYWIKKYNITIEL